MLCVQMLFQIFQLETRQGYGDMHGPNFLLFVISPIVWHNSALETSSSDSGESASITSATGEDISANFSGGTPVRIDRRNVGGDRSAATPRQRRVSNDTACFGGIYRYLALAPLAVSGDVRPVHDLC